MTVRPGSLSRPQCWLRESTRVLKLMELYPGGGGTECRVSFTIMIIYNKEMNRGLFAHLYVNISKSLPDLYTLSSHLEGNLKPVALAVFANNRIAFELQKILIIKGRGGVTSDLLQKRDPMIQAPGAAGKAGGSPRETELRSGEQMGL